ncbi:MAG TPA: hypothetical protein VD903_17240 [Pseudonocardia sp.]|nr:hypothetical protein [Pseudonocardia sp.]
MRSVTRWIWGACGLAGAVVVALVAALVPSVGAGAEPFTAGAGAEPLTVGTPVTVPVGELGANAVTPTPDGRRLLVLTGSGVAVVDSRTSEVLGTITLPFTLSGLLLAPDGTRAYTSSADGIVPLDLTTGLIGDVLVGAAEDGVPTSLDGISPDGTRLSGVIHATESGVGLVDLSSGTARRIPLPSTAASDAVVVTTDATRVYVGGTSYEPSPTTEPLEVIDVATGTTTPVAGTEGTLSVALSRDGRSVYGIGFSQAVVLDAATGTVTRSVPTSLLSGEFVISRSGRYLFVVDVSGNGVEVFDMESGGIVATIPIGAQPGDLALAPDDSALYVASQAGFTVVPLTGGG